MATQKDWTDVTLRLYTSANALRWQEMARFVGDLAASGASVDALDANTQAREDNFSCIPCIIVKRAGRDVYHVEVRAPEDFAPDAWTAPGGLLDPDAIRAADDAAQAAIQQAQDDADAEAAYVATQLQTMTDCLASDASLSQYAKIAFTTLLQIVPPDVLAPVAEQVDAAYRAANPTKTPAVSAQADPVKQ